MIHDTEESKHFTYYLYKLSGQRNKIGWCLIVEQSEVRSLNAGPSLVPGKITSGKVML